MDFGAALMDIWRATLLYVPKAVGFIAILLIGFVVARLLRRGVRRLLERFGFNRAVRRGGITRFLAGSRYEASDIVAMLAYYTVLLFTLQLAFGIWGPNPVSGLIAAVVAWLPRAIVAIVILVVAAALASAVKDVIATMLSSLSYGRLLANLAATFIVGLGVIAALNQIGIATTVTTPVLITVLATIGGILVVGVGGGMIRPMQDRWERWLSKAEEESGAVRENIKVYAESRREAMEAEAAAQREAETAPAVGMQPMGTTFAPGKASVNAANYPPVQARPDQRNGWPAAGQPNRRNDWPTEREPDPGNGGPVDVIAAQGNGGSSLAVPAQGNDWPTERRPDPGNGGPADAIPAQGNDAAEGAQPEPEQRMEWPEQARPDSPTLPVRTGAPAQRPGNDAPTQILRPVDPDER